MRKSLDTFSSEKDLTEKAVDSEFLHSLMRESQFCEYEVDGFFGIPDLVIASIDEMGKVDAIAFEMKLSKWRKALRQAFRYKAFTQRVFVVMDDAYVDRALAEIDRFQEANVGLISIDVGGNVQRHFEPSVEKPYSENLRRSFVDTVCRSTGDERPLESA